jgi:hypothetical protein
MIGIRSEDAEIMELVLRTLDLASDDDLSRFARLYGGSIQRLVAAGIQFFDRASREPVGASSLPDEEKDALVYEKGGEYTYLISPRHSVAPGPTPRANPRGLPHRADRGLHGRAWDRAASAAAAARDRLP